MTISKRDSSIDVLKIFATFCVISVHFFLNNGFYSQPVVGFNMFVAVTMRTFFMICVPSFMIITGHLMSQKKLSVSYYKGIKKTLAIYVLASIAHIIYKNIKLHETYTFGSIILSILGFKAANYSWYIEMYIGLFLMIPFLNNAYNALANKKQKQILVVTFIFLTSIPSIINTYIFSIEGWWSNPASNSDFAHLIPEWWTGIYPITYYFIGCYLKEYRLSLNKLKCFGILLITLLCAGSYNFYRSHGSAFIGYDWADWQSIFTVILTVMVYMIITDTKWINNLSSKPKSILKYLSDITLGAYLVSFIIDNASYQKLITAVPSMPDRLPYYFIMVPFVFICSMILSAILELFYQCLCIIFSAIGNLLHK